MFHSNTVQERGEFGRIRIRGIWLSELFKVGDLEAKSEVVIYPQQMCICGTCEGG